MRRAWRELGFWYDRLDEPPLWVLRGSATGLMGLSRELRDYADVLERRNPDWDHEHLGPYGYLELCHQSRPAVTPHAIEGGPDDFRRLALDLDARLDASEPGSVLHLDSFYGTVNSARMELRVESPQFDPASVDHYLPPDPSVAT